MRDMYRPIEDFYSYEINPYGVVRSRKTGHVKKRYSHKRNEPRYMIKLSYNGKVYARSVRVLARQTWGFYLGEI